MKGKLALEIALPVIFAALLTLLNAVGFYREIELAIYDLLLHVKRPVAEHPRLLLADIDDTAIAKVGTFPWSRDIMADGLVTMKEFDAAYAVFDIEYVNDSPRGLDNEFLTTSVPDAFAREFAEIDRNVRVLFEALQSGNIPLTEAAPFVEQLSQLNQEARVNLENTIGAIARNNDVYLGQAAYFFENAFFTVNMLDATDPDVPEEHKQWVAENLPLGNVRFDGGEPEGVPDMRPAILPVLSGAKGAGFPNVLIDEDGVRRRINLLMRYQDDIYGQLATRPLLDWLGMPDIQVSPRRIRLVGATMPGSGEVVDIDIPRAHDGTVLVNWPASGFLESFRHITYWHLVRHRRLETALLNNLAAMDADGFTAFAADPRFLDDYYTSETLKQAVLRGADHALLADWRAVREQFFAIAGEFLNGPALEQILAEIDFVIGSDQFPAADREFYAQLRADGVITDLFVSSRDVHANLIDQRQRLRAELPGAFVIIGHTGTSTTDIGVNPFEQRYMNVGTHASLVNTILQREFLDDAPWWVAVIAGLVLALAIMAIIRKLDPLPSTLVGLGFVLVVAGAGVVFFLLSGIHVNLLTPVLVVFLTVVGLSLMKFLVTAKEKTFLRSAFSHYLSTDVINELVDDPSKLKLGGDEKHLTAMFTDVKGFSTVAEQLTPTDLVKLLNEYLSEMSNIILAERGTIDKYEGDAIISFFGAPVEFDDHAVRGCRAAVRMRKVEAQLNERFLADKMSPVPLLTRFGINTGRMVVGNMGTEGKMDYTIMGTSVNLAARLEGVNKQYGTWTLISENTLEETDSEFAVRKMDKVRVVGIHEPVRLFELVDERSQAPAELVEAIDTFHDAQDRFEAHEYERARRRFVDVLAIVPDDAPTQLYIQRCDEFIKKPPADDWDGVFNLTIK